MPPCASAVPTYGVTGWSTHSLRGGGRSQGFQPHTNLTCDAVASCWRRRDDTADGPWQHLFYQLTAANWETSTSRTIRLRHRAHVYKRSLLNAVQGRSARADARSLSGAVLTTEHPTASASGGTELVQLLMDPNAGRSRCCGYRGRAAADCPAIRRQYSLLEIATLRLRPARALGCRTWHSRRRDADVRSTQQPEQGRISLFGTRYFLGARSSSRRYGDRPAVKGGVHRPPDTDAAIEALSCRSSAAYTISFATTGRLGGSASEPVTSRQPHVTLTLKKPPSVSARGRGTLAGLTASCRTVPFARCPCTSENATAGGHFSTWTVRRATNYDSGRCLSRELIGRAMERGQIVPPATPAFTSGRHERGAIDVSGTGLTGVGASVWRPDPLAAMPGPSWRA